MAKAPSTSIYQIKVTLTAIRPPIWRRLLVPSTIRLNDLHTVLQTAMGWMGGHLHQFEVEGCYFGAPDDELGMDVEDETRVRLNQLLVHEKDWMRYEYDFGDGWIHRIVLEKILPPLPEMKKARCIGGARACPPEDCGGVPGYAMLLEALGDPAHPEHKQMRKWLGKTFDPAAFNIEAVNQWLGFKLT